MGYILRRMDQRSPQESAPQEQPPEPSRQAELPVRFLKAVAQTLIGAGAVVVVAVQVIRALAAGRTLLQVHHEVFALFGLAVILAAVVELAFTLYSQRSDAALGPLLLGISGALLFQLGSARVLDVREGLAALLYVAVLAVLAGLAAMRKYLSKERPATEQTIWVEWKQVQQWDRQRRRPRPRSNGRSRTKEGRHYAVSQAAEVAQVDQVADVAEVAVDPAGALGAEPESPGQNTDVQV